MSIQNEEVTFASVIRGHVSKLSKEIHTALPGRVESYDASTQKADVKPLIKSEDIDEEGNAVYYPIPVITDVPVVFPGGGGFRVTFPLTKGSTVLLVFSEASLDTWLSKGGDVEPGVDSRHELTDAIAIPGLNTFTAPLSNAPSSTMSVGADNTTATIEFSDTQITAGGAGADALITRTEFNTHTHPVPSLGTSSAPLPLAVGTTVFKAK